MQLMSFVCSIEIDNMMIMFHSVNEVSKAASHAQSPGPSRHCIFTRALRARHMSVLRMNLFLGDIMSRQRYSEDIVQRSCKLHNQVAIILNDLVDMESSPVAVMT